jgi:transcriptional regulator with XRE-family HTH domain
MMTDIRKIFGTNLRTYRKELGLSQAALAELADTATNYLGLIEAGKKFPSADMIEKLAAALRRDPIDLFALNPVQEAWQAAILDEIEALIRTKRLEYAEKAAKEE